MSRRNIVLWLGTSAGIVAILVMIFRYDPGAVFLPILRSEPQRLLGLLVLMWTTQFLNSLTPWVLLGPTGSESRSRWADIRVFLAIQPLALVVPGRVSDFGALPLLRNAYEPGAVASAIVLDRVITLLVLLTLTPWAARFVTPIEASTTVNLVAGLFILVIGAIPFLLVNRAVRNHVNRYVLRFIPDAFRGFGSHTEHLLRASKGGLAINLGLTALKTLVAAGTLSLLAANVGLRLDLFTAIWMSVLVQLITSVPVSAHGLGLAEGSLVVLFSFNELPEPLALSIMFVARVLLIFAMLPIYLLTTVPLISENIRDA